MVEVAGQLYCFGEIGRRVVLPWQRRAMTTPSPDHILSRLNRRRLARDWGLGLMDDRHRIKRISEFAAACETNLVCFAGYRERAA
jgi:hypothetical protein